MMKTIKIDGALAISAPRVTDPDIEWQMSSRREFPIRVLTGEQGGVAASDRVTDEEAFVQTAGKVLIVDDEKFNCDIIYGFLMVLGLKNRQEKSEIAYNGEQAVEAFVKAIEEGDPFRYPLVIMDCNMPFLDGYEATK